MKRNYIIALLLIGFGIVAGSLHRIIFLKVSTDLPSAYAISFLAWKDFAEGFVTPAIIFAVYVIVLKTSTRVFLFDNVPYLPMLIAVSLVPRYLYLASYVWHLPDLNSDKVGFVPGLLILFPIIPYFLAMWVRERKSLVGVLLAICAPLALIGFLLSLLDHL